MAAGLTMQEELIISVLNTLAALSCGIVIALLVDAKPPALHHSPIYSNNTSVLLLTP